MTVISVNIKIQLKVFWRSITCLFMKVLHITMVSVNICLHLNVVSRPTNSLHFIILIMNVISAKIWTGIKMILSYTNKQFTRVWFKCVVIVTMKLQNKVDYRNINRILTKNQQSYILHRNYVTANSQEITIILLFYW